MRFYCDAGTCVARGMDIRLLMCAEGHHGLVQEDQGELRRVCCCAAHISNVGINVRTT